MKRKNNNQEVESNYNREESFDFDHIPSHFDSVKASSIRKIKRSAMEKVATNTDFDAGALEMALKSIDGLFGSAYKTLDGDYDARLSKIKQAYRDGLKKVRTAFRRYELQAELHNSAFDRYNKANKALNGTELSSSLMVSQREIDEFRKRIDALAQNHEERRQ